MNASLHDSYGEQYQCFACGSALAFDPAQVADSLSCPHCERPLWFLKKSVDGAVVLAFLSGEIASTESVERIDEVLSAFSDASHLVLDLGHMRVLVSSFLNMLIKLDRKTTFAYQTLRLCGLSANVAKVFEITKLDTKFDIYDNEQAALADS